MKSEKRARNFDKNPFGTLLLIMITALIIISVGYFVLYRGVFNTHSVNTITLTEEFPIKYADELAVALGAFEVSDPTDITAGPFLSYSSSTTYQYKSWDIRYADATGKTQTFILNNRDDINSSIWMESYRLISQRVQSLLSNNQASVMIEDHRENIDGRPIDSTNKHLLPTAIDFESLEDRMLIAVTIQKDKLDETVKILSGIAETNFLVFYDGEAYLMSEGVAILLGEPQFSKFTLDQFNKLLMDQYPTAKK